MGHQKRTCSAIFFHTNLHALATRHRRCRATPCDITRRPCLLGFVRRRVAKGDRRITSATRTGNDRLKGSGRTISHRLWQDVNATRCSAAWRLLQSLVRLTGLYSSSGQAGTFEIQPAIVLYPAFYRATSTCNFFWLGMFDHKPRKPIPTHQQ